MDWKSWTTQRKIIAVSVTVVVILLSSLVVILVPDWPDWTGLDGKTAWDLAELLIIPVMLVLVGYWLNEQARKREDEAEKRQEDQLKKRLILQMRHPNNKIALEGLSELSTLGPLELRGVDLSGGKLPWGRPG